MSRTVVKRGDTHAITFTVNANLTGSTVRLICRHSNATVEDLDTDITDATNGVVVHALTGELAVGVYDLELEITQDGTISTAPTSGYARLIVKQDLG